ncbi:hypothetical protein FRC06_002831, partial [Ceratobasidium sp. 370]
MSRRRSNLFMHVKSAPNPEANPTLWEHRLRQARPLSRNPFVPDDSSASSYEGAAVDSPGPTTQPVKFDSSTSNGTSQEELRVDTTNHDIEWGEHAPEWLNLFYDLAWTASFASLTSNNKFKQPWDSVSYIVFFSIMWWMWTAQVFYSVDFYTDDWRLIIFGALAATTRGFDVSTYILHSPGSTEWEDTAIETITPEQFSNERVAQVSLVAISIILALSRSKHYPLRLLLVPIALAISTALFFVAFVITKRHGEEPTGAKIKFYLWAPALLLEVIAHIVRFQWDINDGIRLKSHGSIAGRLSGITTIILGEGINAIAGTFYAIEKAPGFGGPTGAAIVCCGIIVFFLAYLYFEGAAPLKSVRRRAAWVMAHLPWLLSAILLLEGVKNQLLLSSFLNSATYLIEQTTNLIYSDGDFDAVAFNNTMRPLMLKAGMTFDSQWAKLVDLINQNMTATNVTDLDDQTLAEIQGVWYYRLEMMSILNTYINFMDNETIADNVQQNINKYQNDYAYVYQANQPEILLGFIWDLIHASVNNARYIMGLCGLTFICLATLNIIQSWPRDRFHWASIISRYIMGFCMVLLVLLNVGKYQTYFQPVDVPDKDRAAIFNWIDANWVLPTLALAYGVQFIVDTALVYAAVWFGRKAHPSTVEKDHSTTIYRGWGARALGHGALFSMSTLFLNINTSPDPGVNPTLWEHRLKQRRPISRNPFEPGSSCSRKIYELRTIDSSTSLATRRSSCTYEGKSSYNVDVENVTSESVIVPNRRNSDREWGDQIPGWLNLFYDLSWTATFSSLTSNAQFRDPWNSISYVIFFTTAWWLWVSQIFYNAEFYTDDWFHMLFTFFQLVLFGALASATRGFDITNYILHSPGSDNLEPYDVDTITPDRYGDERLAKISIRVIMISISVSRALLLIQHLRVALYAKITSKAKHYPLKLFIVPASLVISSALFFAAFSITMDHFGQTPEGATLKFVLWGVAILVEVVAHIVMFQMDFGEGDGIKLRSHGSITERLTDITTIILGEASLPLLLARYGINAIAGTFYAIEKAPGFSSPTGTGIVCCAIIVFFLAYSYFNGAAPLKAVRRRAAWVMMHLPWLLTVILLLEGVKNQLLLQSFIASSTYMIAQTSGTISANLPMDQLSAKMRPLLLQGGISYSDEYAAYISLLNQTISSDADVDPVMSESLGVWFLRLELKVTFNTYITFMDNDSIPDTTQQTIQKYLNDDNYTLEDYHSLLTTSSSLPHFYQILNELVRPGLNNVRYIMAMCGGTFITLASLNLIQSWPRGMLYPPLLASPLIEHPFFVDRFHWASIFSRYAIGIVMLLLLLLNLGKSQTYAESADTPLSQRAGFLRWVDSNMVLPTLALAYVIQFIIDT